MGLQRHMKLKWAKLLKQHDTICTRIVLDLDVTFMKHIACNFDVPDLLRYQHKSKTRHFNYWLVLTIFVNILHKKVENLEELCDNVL